MIRQSIWKVLCDLSMQIPLLKTYPVLIASCNKRYLVLYIFVEFFLLLYAAQIRYTYNVHLLFESAWQRPGSLSVLV
jgi:hypothetical protein